MDSRSASNSAELEVRKSASYRVDVVGLALDRWRIQPARFLVVHLRQHRVGAPLAAQDGRPAIVQADPLDASVR
jgi:hypothetical protein